MSEECVFPQRRKSREPGEPAFLEVTGGLTKRELFAAMAMATLVNSYRSDTTVFQDAETAVVCADALIAALAKEKT